MIGNKFRKTPIGRIPEDWEVVRLEDIAEEMYYGITAKATQENTGIRMLRTTDIKNYSVDWSSLPYCEITEKRGSLQRYLLKRGDLIVARSGTVGVSVLVEKDFDNIIFGSYLIKVKLKPDAYPKFVHYFFQTDIYWNHITKAQGSTLKNINLPLLKSLLIPLPPLEEQRKIAEILSTVDKAIEKVDEAIVKTERLKKGLMQELLTKGIGHKEFKKVKLDGKTIEIPKSWEVVALGDIAEISTGTTPSTKNPEYWNGDIPFIKTTDIDNNIITESKVFISEKAVRDYNLKVFPPDTVLIAMYGQGKTRGKVALVKIHATTSQNAAILVLNKHISSPKYVWYYLMSKYADLRRTGVHGQISHLNLSFVRKFRILLPPLEEQQKIAEILSTIDKKLELQRKRKEKLERIKKGLMNDLLTGKRRVKIK